MAKKPDPETVASFYPCNFCPSRSDVKHLDALIVNAMAEGRRMAAEAGYPGCNLDIPPLPDDHKVVQATRPQADGGNEFEDPLSAARGVVFGLLAGVGIILLTLTAVLLLV